jgi:hypothetical protein
MRKGRIKLLNNKYIIIIIILLEYIFFLILRTPKMPSRTTGGTRTPGWISPA